ncbi:MAG TPA: hypothetical protein VHC18_05715 [Amycolatopsis sp.]|nr:hypothetical protein [Amycolatopsis sp.]
MKRSTAGKAVLAAVALGAAVMLVVTVQKDTTVSAASVASPSPPEITETSPAVTTEAQASSSPPPSTISPQMSQNVAANAQRALRRTVSSAKLGMEVYDRQTHTVVTSVDAGTQFASMSVVKLLIAVDILARDGAQMPGQSTADEITRMLSSSDDAIASSFWESGGGPAIITRDVALMGLTGTKPPTSAGEWGGTKITAQDIVTVYDYVLDELPDPARDLLYNAMYQAPREGADGTDQYFGIPDGLPGTTWAIKQGWGSDGPYAYYNTTGIVGADSRYVVVLLSSGPLSAYRTMPRALTAATAALAPVFAQP